MTMHPWFKFAIICTIVTGIVLFCVVFGGYSSIYRSQNRIQASLTQVTDTCNLRTELLPDLIKAIEQTPYSDAGISISQAGTKATLALQQLLSRNQPIESGIVKEFEVAQEELSQQLAAFFSLIASENISASDKHILQLKDKFSTLQDSLFVTKKRYNKEVNYFNSRTTVFPGFLIAKLFGLNQLKYTQISKEVFLSGEKTFVPVAS